MVDLDAVMDEDMVLKLPLLGSDVDGDEWLALMILLVHRFPAQGIR